MLQAGVTKPLREYIEKRHAMVEEWVALEPIFEVCTKETVYKGEGKLHKPWWWQAATEQQLEAKLKNISSALEGLWRQESDRRSGVKVSI